MLKINYILQICCSLAVCAGAAQAAPSVTLLHVFKGAPDGATPKAGVIVASSGALYGTASAGGKSNNGAIFALEPPKKPGRAWKSKIIYAFAGDPDGADPEAALIEDSNGVLYGTTAAGGTSDGGTIFSLTPGAKKKNPWTEAVLYRFLGATQDCSSQLSDGFTPTGRLLLDSSGALYGSTYDGGAPDYGVGISCLGTWFKLSPPAQGQTTWTESLESYAGDDPTGGLTADSSGRMYGASEYGNLLNGTVLFSEGTTSWVDAGGYGRNGENPSDVVLGADGTMYVTTVGGGAVPNGGVLALPVTNNGETPGKFMQIYNFAGGTDGYFPRGPLVAGPNGSFYGTTSSGGASGFGTIFQLTPPPQGQTTWTHTVLYSFDGTASSPTGPLTAGPGGVYYGTTTKTSASGTYGAVFQFSP